VSVLSTHPGGPTPSAASTPEPRFGGLLWRLARTTSGLMRPLAGKRWIPIFAVIHHQGRTSGRLYATPVAARRSGNGFVISLAFGAQVDWYRNLVAASGGVIRWRGREYAVGAPERVDAAIGRTAFNPIQRWALRAGGIDGYIRVPDVSPSR
jgi:deazaflavin-dependent oxidoreductase (nitroreductase family)